MPFADLLGNSRLAGYEDVNCRATHEIRFRLIGSEKNWDQGQHCHPGCNPSRRTLLAEEENFAGLARVNRELIGNAEAIDSPHRTVLDMDSTEIPV